MQFVRSIQTFLTENESTIKSGIGLVSAGFSIATYLGTRWMRRRMRREAEERHKVASRFGLFSGEHSTVSADGLLKNDVLFLVEGSTVVRDQLLFEKVMAAKNHEVFDPNPDIGNIGLLKLERDLDSKALLLACTAKISESFAAERVMARLSRDCVEVQMVVAFRHDTFKPKGTADGHSLSRIVMVPKALLKRMAEDAAFRDSVKTEGGKAHQLDRCRHMIQMWEACNSSDPLVQATVWEFTLAFRKSSFPDGLAEWI